MPFDPYSIHYLQNISLNKNLILSIIRCVLKNSGNSDFPVVFCSCDICSDTFRAKFDAEEDIRNQLSNKTRINYVNFYFQNPQKSLRHYKVTHSVFISIEHKDYSDPSFHQLRISVSSNNAIQAEYLLENAQNWLAICLPIDTQSIDEHDTSSGQVVLSSENKTEDKVVDSVAQITINNPSISIDFKNTTEISENKSSPKRKDFLLGTLQATIIELVRAITGYFLPK